MSVSCFVVVPVFVVHTVLQCTPAFCTPFCTISFVVDLHKVMFLFRTILVNFLIPCRTKLNYTLPHVRCNKEEQRMKKNYFFTERQKSFSIHPHHITMWNLSSLVYGHWLIRCGQTHFLCLLQCGLLLIIKRLSDKLAN